MEYNFQGKISPIQDYSHVDDHIPATHEMNAAFKLFIDYEQSPFFLRENTRGVIFTRACVSLTLLTQKKNRDYS